MKEGIITIIVTENYLVCESYFGIFGRSRYYWPGIELLLRKGGGAFEMGYLVFWMPVVVPKLYY